MDIKNKVKPVSAEQISFFQLIKTTQQI